MRAIWITKHGGPDVLQVRESADPVPKEGEIRVRVRAAGLNFAEVMARSGLYPDAPKPPCIVGYEVAGVVDAVGGGVTAPSVGTRVIALTRFGGHADTVCVPAAYALPMPDGMSFEEGGALPVVYLTAYHVLFRIGHLRPGSRVLVHMAAGGVGLAAIQLCRTVADVEVYGTASSSKHEFLRQQGCHHCIDYRTADFAAEITKLTGGGGVDLVLDPLGGKNWRKGYDLLNPAGMLVAYGFASLASGEKRNLLRVAGGLLSVPKFSPMSMMDHNRAVAGVNMGHLWDRMDMLEPELKELLRLYGEGKIKPIVDRVFPFTEAAAAHRRIHARSNVGKVVFVP